MVCQGLQALNQLPPGHSLSDASGLFSFGHQAGQSHHIIRGTCHRLQPFIVEYESGLHSPDTALRDTDIVLHSTDTGLHSTDLFCTVLISSCTVLTSSCTVLISFAQYCHQMLS